MLARTATVYKSNTQFFWCHSSFFLSFIPGLCVLTFSRAFGKIVAFLRAKSPQKRNSCHLERPLAGL
jgi:hypothetical protein